MQSTEAHRIFGDLEDIIDVDDNHVKQYDEPMVVSHTPMLQSTTLLNGELYIGELVIGGEYMLLAELPDYSGGISEAQSRPNVDKCRHVSSSLSGHVQLCTNSIVEPHDTFDPN